MNKAPGGPPYPLVGEHNGTHWILWPREFLQFPVGTRGFPHFSIRSRSLLFRSCSFGPQLSCKGSCSLHTCIFEFAYEVEYKFSILLCCHHFDLLLVNYSRKKISRLQSRRRKGSKEPIASLYKLSTNLHFPYPYPSLQRYLGNLSYGQVFVFLAC